MTDILFIDRHIGQHLNTVLLLTHHPIIFSVAYQSPAWFIVVFHVCYDYLFTSIPRPEYHVLEFPFWNFQQLW